MKKKKMLMKGGGEFATLATMEMGYRAEMMFQSLCRARNMTCRKATRFENVAQHFDFVVFPWSLFPIDRRNVRVEVKAMKCKKRGGTPDPTLIYVELKSVLGHKGWVHGDADVIAFEQPANSFLIVKRDELAAKAEEWASKAEMGTQSGQKGKLWTRHERHDLVYCADRDTEIKTLQTVAEFK